MAAELQTRKLGPTLLLSWSPLLLAASVVQTPAPASASASQPAQAASAPQGAGATNDGPTDAGGAVEQARSSVRSTAEWLARTVDRWFGDEPLKEGASVTDGRLSLALYKRRDDRLNVG